MSKQEMYAWSSLASSIAIAGFYIIAVFGWPESLPDYSDRLASLFIKVFLIAFIVEFVLGLLSNKTMIEKDERDITFASKGYKIGYYIFIVGVNIIMFNVLIGGFIGTNIPDSVLQEQEGIGFFTNPFNIFHSLFFLMIMASMAKRSTQLYFYRKGF